MQYARNSFVTPWKPEGRLKLLPLISIFMLASGLGACSWVDSLNPFEEESATNVAANEPFPNLGTVPSESPGSLSPADKERLRQGLVADRANAEYINGANYGANAGAAGAGEVPLAAPSTPIDAQPLTTLPSAPPLSSPPAAVAPQPASPTAAPADPGGFTSGFANVESDSTPAAPPPVTVPVPGNALATITFTAGSAALSGQDIAALKEIAAQHADGHSQIRLIGPADNDDYVKIVAYQLVQSGLPADRLIGERGLPAGERRVEIITATN